MSHRDAPPPPKPPPWRPHRRRRRSAPSDTPCSVHRDLLLLSTATSPAQFVAEDYLAAACGLTPAQAAKASRRLRHLDSASNPDAVRAFLGGVGLSDADVAAAIVRDPRILCSRVDKTLAPKVARLRGIGLSPPQISRLVVLEQCCLSDSDMANLFMLPGSGKLISMKLECLKETVVRAERLGVSRYSGLFKNALLILCRVSHDRISGKMEFLKMALGCPEAEQAVCKCPMILALSEDRLGRTVEFLRMGVGLEPGYIARRSAILIYSLERRLIPRHHVINALMVKRLVKKRTCFYSVVCATKKAFKGRLIMLPMLQGKCFPKPRCEM